MPVTPDAVPNLGKLLTLRYPYRPRGGDAGADRLGQQGVGACRLLPLGVACVVEAVHPGQRVAGAFHLRPLGVACVARADRLGQQAAEACRLHPSGAACGVVAAHPGQVVALHLQGGGVAACHPGQQYLPDVAFGVRVSHLVPLPYQLLRVLAVCFQPLPQGAT